MRIRHGLPATVIIALLAASAHAADGDLDPTFGDGGFRLAGILDGYATLVTGTAVQPDGKIVTCATEGATAYDFFVARFTADGAIATSFSFDGHTTIDFGGNDDVCSGIVVQANGKIVVSGTTTPPAGTNADFAIARLNSDGSRDTAFNLTGRLTVGFNLAASTSKDDQAQQLAIDASGRIIAAGAADNGPGGLDMAVLRLLPSGLPDADFNADGRATIAFDLGGANGNNDDQTASASSSRATGAC